MFTAMHYRCSTSSHSSDLSLSGILLQARIKMLPPLEKHRLTDQLEPRRKDEFWVLEHDLQFVGSHVAAVFDFIGVDICIDVGLDEEDVVNWGINLLANQVVNNLRLLLHEFLEAPLPITNVRS
jgi:hypothetical protein